MKLLERLVAKQLFDYLNTARLHPTLQPAYRGHHSTKMVVVCRSRHAASSFEVDKRPWRYTVLQLSTDSGHISAIASSVSVTELANPTLQSSWMGSQKDMSLNRSHTADLLPLVESHRLIVHFYANDTQIIWLMLAGRCSAAGNTSCHHSWMQ